MMDFLILVISVTALLQFFVCYCHALVRASRDLELSGQARAVTGFTVRNVSGGEFGRVLQLMRLCPVLAGSGPALAPVRLYYAFLGGVRTSLGWTSRGFADWLEGERGGCAYFAAVALDHRIASSRALMSGQIPKR
ncbi:MAG: hypothetical protein WBF06_15560 [Candidatus Acidiferrales bacterium]